MSGTFKILKLEFKLEMLPKEKLFNWKSCKIRNVALANNVNKK